MEKRGLNEENKSSDARIHTHPEPATGGNRGYCAPTNAVANVIKVEEGRPRWNRLIDNDILDEKQQVTGKE
jgi:hypothetical protein